MLTPSSPAIMIHGGSFMTFAKNIIRPWQIPLLLKCGFLPVSLDHRLIPETTLADGPMTDIRDGFVWARNELAQIASKTRNFILDPDKIVIVGWSTGATLAMSTAWTSRDAGVKPPEAILNFYGPSDFESQCTYSQAFQLERRVLMRNRLAHPPQSRLPSSHLVKPGDCKTYIPQACKFPKSALWKKAKEEETTQMNNILTRTPPDREL